jgi:hypothetical protein
MKEKIRVKHVTSIDISQMTAYQKWRVLLGIIQVVVTLGIPWVTILVYRALDYQCK